MQFHTVSAALLAIICRRVDTPRAVNKLPSLVVLVYGLPQILRIASPTDIALQSCHREQRRLEDLTLGGQLRVVHEDNRLEVSKGV